MTTKSILKKPDLVCNGQRDRDRNLLLDSDPCCAMDFEESNPMSYSVDAGYESFSSINSSLDSSSSNRSSLGVNDSMAAPPPPPPRTPLKTARFNTSTNIEYTADINSMYMASIRSFNSSSFDSLSSSSCSPYRSQNASHFRNISLSSASSSPVASQSPGKFLADNYLHERDSFNKKLLRSPAFKMTPSSYVEMSPTKPPIISSFTERLKLDSQPVKQPIVVPRTQTLTEEEFMQRLIQDKWLPSNPRNLIGYNMGVEQMDIMTELSERCMPNIVDQILGYMSERELVTIGSVCTSWRGLIKRERKWQQKHYKYVEKKRKEYTVCKENLEVSRQKAAWRERKAVYQSLKGASISIDQSLNGSMNDSSVAAFGILDMNCMDNISITSYDKNRSVTNQTRGPLSHVQVNRGPVMTLMMDQQPVKPILTTSQMRGSVATSSPRKRVPISPIKPFAGTKKASPSKTDYFGSKKNKKLLKRL